MVSGVPIGGEDHLVEQRTDALHRFHILLVGSRDGQCTALEEIMLDIDYDQGLFHDHSIQQ